VSHSFCNAILVLFIEMIAPHIDFIGQKPLNELLQKLAAFAISGHIVPENLGIK